MNRLAPPAQRRKWKLPVSLYTHLHTPPRTAASYYPPLACDIRSKWAEAPRTPTPLQSQPDGRRERGEMAAAPEDLVELLSPFLRQMQRLESQLRCAQCSNLLVEPTLLPCDHIICWDCVVAAGKNVYSCPICQAPCHCRETKPAVHVSKMVDIFRDMDADIVKIAQRSQSHDAIFKRESNSPSRPCLVEGANKSAAKGPCEEKYALHPTEEAKSVGSKRGISEGNEDATETKRPKLQCKKQNKQTPINLFPDECVFCHSFRTSSKYHGPMRCCVNGRVVTVDEAGGLPLDQKGKNSFRRKAPNRAGVVYVHQKCLEWAPKICYEGDDVKNLQSEINRASRLKCSSCRLPGAALGCYYYKCKKSFHVPCLMHMVDSRWDEINMHVMCPKHASERLPCDDDSTSPAKKGNDCAPSPPRNKWILLSSALPTSEKELLQEFATLAKATVSDQWTPDVTHVIVAKNDGCAWTRSYEVLMAILSGKWVVTTGWLQKSLLEGQKVAEEPYEIKISHNLYGSIEGPKKGRMQAAEGGSKLFSGLSFCLSAYLNPDNRGRLQDIITTAGGEILKENVSQENVSQSFLANSGQGSIKTYFVYNGGAPENFESNFLLGVQKEIEESVEYAAAGAQVISHIRVFSAIAAYDVQMLSSRVEFCL